MPQASGTFVVGGPAVRVCAQSGCPEWTESTRCVKHTRAKDQARGSRQDRGYGTRHSRLRADYQRRMDAGETYDCWRCLNPIDPSDWCLGHCDDDRGRYHGPECGGCNYATSGRADQHCPHPSHTPERSTSWPF